MHGRRHWAHARGGCVSAGRGDACARAVEVRVHVEQRRACGRKRCEAGVHAHEGRRVTESAREVGTRRRAPAEVGAPQ